MLPVALSYSTCARACNAAPALTPEPDEWQPVVRRKRQNGLALPVTTLAQTDSTVCSRPDRACKRPRGSYAILADLDEEEPAPPPVRRGQKRDRQQAQTPAVPAALAGPPVQPAAADVMTSQPDEAPVIPLLCSNDSLLTASSEVPCEQRADTQPAAKGTTGRQLQRLKAAQATDIVRTTETEQQPSIRQTQPSRRKRKAVSQQILQLTDRPGPRTPTPQVASQPDEASAALLLCSSDDLTAASPAAACVPCADPHPATSATMHRRQKKLKTAQATEPGQQPSVWHTQPPRNKRKAISQPNLQRERRSTRQRFCPRVFDPSDPTAVAGYVQHRGVSPDMQSSLPFDTG